MPSNHQAIIDAATFDAAQAKLKDRWKVASGRHRKYFLSGVRRCGHCGSILVGGCRGKGQRVLRQAIPNATKQRHDARPQQIVDTQQRLAPIDADAIIAELPHLDDYLQATQTD